MAAERACNERLCINDRAACAIAHGSGCLASAFTTAIALKKLDSTCGQSQAQFEKLKTLAGQWTATTSHGEGQEKTSNFRYAVTAGGTAAVKTLFEGSEQEMVAVFRLDGHNLVLTHYCVLGNQPRMITRSGDDVLNVAFEFAGSSNIKSKDDQHMHQATYSFVTGDHVYATWVMHKNGKEVERVDIDLHRKK
ncbi:MAG: hypothetical protein QGH33_07555 [Pirellulaceae bacterium]|jgi:hypothetical protein|nr:hypothetical protein [Pirellulaceae bacterium]